MLVSKFFFSRAKEEVGANDKSVSHFDCILEKDIENDCREGEERLKMKENFFPFFKQISIRFAQFS